MAVTCILQFHYQSTNKIWGKSNRHDIIFSNIELFPPGLPVRFCLKCLLQYYPLITTQGNHMQVARTLFLRPRPRLFTQPPPPPPTSVYTSLDSIDIKLFGFVRKSMKQLYICIINVWGYAENYSSETQGQLHIVGTIEWSWTVKVYYYKTDKSPWALTLTDPWVPEAFESPASDWPERKIFWSTSEKEQPGDSGVFLHYIVFVIIITDCHM